MPHSGFPTIRLRRLRQHAGIRAWVRHTHLRIDKLIFPLFIKEGNHIKNPIAAMPGHFQWSIDYLAEEIQTLVSLGISSVLLFGIPLQKDEKGSAGYADHGVISQAVRLIKKIAPSLLVVTDVCCCEYTHHGHCGVMDSTQDHREVMVDNDKTLALLAKQAVSHAKAGADVIAPSANMDGMVATIRQALDAAGFSHIPILSYTVKYASSLYSPFRQAAEGAPQFGDRSTYQMDYANHSEALRECRLDIAEGADMLMVKPAHTYLDMIYQIKQQFPEMPLCAYHTSGEYAMLKAAGEQGWIDEKKVMVEVLTAIHRAGADCIITYFAKEVAQLLRELQ